MAGKRIQADCLELDDEGKGIVKVPGEDVSLRYVLPGETLLLEVEKGYYGPEVRLVEVLKSSPDRVKALCPVYRLCGGCQLQHMNYKAQLSFKEELVRSLLGRFAPVQAILGMENPWDYRNKALASLALGQEGKTVSGIFGEKSHQVVPVDHCLIQDPSGDRIVASILGMMRSFKMKPFEEDKGRGFLRHVLIKRGFTSGEVMVVLVVASLTFPSRSNFVKELVRQHPEITTIVLNENKRRTSVVLGREERVLYGPGFISDSLMGLKFRISARSFYQVNPVQTEVLYEVAMRMAGLSGRESVLDAYCGIGTIGLIAAKKAKQVLGVEVNPDAVRDAVGNARGNGVRNARFVCGDAGEFMREEARRGSSYDVVFMDPPRAGADEAFLSALVELAPKRVVYVSCNPHTLERDLTFLWQQGYVVQEVQPVDMFPQTFHVETVVLMSREKVLSED